MAEEVGFEPTFAFTKTVFKTAAFNHSATPPIVSSVKIILPQKYARKILRIFLFFPEDHDITSGNLKTMKSLKTWHYRDIWCSKADVIREISGKRENRLHIGFWFMDCAEIRHQSVEYCQNPGLQLLPCAPMLHSAIPVPFVMSAVFVQVEISLAKVKT